ncbi:MAG: hypothetical protein AB1758_13515 [Candidatus Eremiobacterota bacterium]
MEPLEDSDVNHTKPLPTTWAYWAAGLCASTLAGQTAQIGSPQQAAMLLVTLLFMWGFVRQ